MSVLDIIYPDSAGFVNFDDVDRWPSVPFSAYEIFDMHAPFAAASTNNLPITEIPQTKTGAAVNNFSRDYYHRIYINPAQIDFGNLTELQTQEVELWNAYLSPQLLSEVAETDTDGLLLTGAAPPTDLKPLANTIYTIQASFQGPLSSESRYDFIFPVDQPVLPVTASRFVAWHFPHNWVHPYLERYEWLTDVLESYNGHEQRIRLRAAPRVSTETRHLATNPARIVMENNLLSWQARVYVVPEWPAAEALIEGVAEGGDVLSVSPTRAFTRCQTLMIRSGDEFEMASIDAVADAGITLKTRVKNSWPAGSQVVPAWQARIDNTAKLERETDSVNRARVRFDYIDPYQFTATDSGLPFYKGLPVMTIRPDWSAPVVDSYSRKTAELDYLTGRRVAIDESGQPIEIVRHRWVVSGRDEIARFKAFVAGQAGKLNGFWLPSFAADVQLTVALAAGAQNLTVANHGFTQVDDTVARRHIEIVSLDGEAYRHQVENILRISDDEEQIGLDAEIDRGLGVQEIERISFLKLVRLDSDAVEVSWVTDALAQIELTARTLAADAP